MRGSTKTNVATTTPIATPPPSRCRFVTLLRRPSAIRGDCEPPRVSAKAGRVTGLRWSGGRRPLAAEHLSQPADSRRVEDAEPRKGQRTLGGLARSVLRRHGEDVARAACEPLDAGVER